MRKRHIDRVTKLAATSEHPQFRVGAILTKGPKVVAKGVNKPKTHPKTALHKKTIHAETAAISRIKPWQAGEADTLYICRLLKDGKLAMSLPCPMCATLLRIIGIKYLCYSGSDGRFHHVRMEE